MLNILVEPGSDTAVLRCVGSLVLGDEAALLCQAMHQSGKAVILDMSLVDRVDAAGIGALIALLAAGVYLKIADPSKPVADVLRLTHVDSVFDIVRGNDVAPGEEVPTDSLFRPRVSASA